jgi:protocatechuate 3,4-dioxygenase beta subunit
METKITPEQHRAEVAASFQNCQDERLREVVTCLSRHILEFVEETKLTRDEWMAGIEFLTATGKKCDDVRQEFILLSDVLGVSMLVEMMNQQPTDAATDPTVLGPFYVPGAPDLEMGESIAVEGDGGEPLVLRGTVRDALGTPLDGAYIEVWQVSPQALYDVQDPTIAPMSYRGNFTTGEDGVFMFRTVRPVDYQIPTDGPVGDLLRATSREAWRPAHTHFLVSHDGYKTLITHLFDAGSAHLRADAVFGVRDSLIVEMEGGESSFDLVLDRASATS